ncbi:FbpB family small basic protein [Virgibacillus oceani]|uniref:FbpB family small basic protein n=1 Tax=Virgibacillus oceani TaxID=1479511 RepID=UPI0027E4D93F|nr:FbpB family small basic protein [Virgibacillus oceani]
MRFIKFRRYGNTAFKKEWITISLKRRLSFDELVRENRKQILQDQTLLDKIEQNLESKRNQTLKKTSR